MTGPLYELLPRGEAGSDELLGRFLDYVSHLGLTLYPAQEDAILALFEGHNVILNTPTGSGKSLVASALHFMSLAHGRRSVYTCPIKALVNEKWMALCRELGPTNVGLSTGDATVNRGGPVLCCTAEILANMALREGKDAAVDDVVMDEFHWYADRDRCLAYRFLRHASSSCPPLSVTWPSPPPVLPPSSVATPCESNVTCAANAINSGRH